MDDWQKTIDALVKAFDEFAVKVKEMADALAEAQCSMHLQILEIRAYKQIYASKIQIKV